MEREGGLARFFSRGGKCEACRGVGRDSDCESDQELKGNGAREGRIDGPARATLGVMPRALGIHDRAEVFGVDPDSELRDCRGTLAPGSEKIICSEIGERRLAVVIVRRTNKPLTHRQGDRHWVPCAHSSERRDHESLSTGNRERSRRRQIKKDCIRLIRLGLGLSQIKILKASRRIHQSRERVCLVVNDVRADRPRRNRCDRQRRRRIGCACDDPKSTDG